METLKEKFDNCVNHTNRVIHKWINVQGIKVGQIHKSDVEAIFLGLIRKTIFQSNYIDFKRFTKCINIHLNNGYLSNISTCNTSRDIVYFKDRGLIDQLVNIIDESTIKFDIDQTPSTINTESEVVYIDDIKQLNFKELQLITF